MSSPQNPPLPGTSLVVPKSNFGLTGVKFSEELEQDERLKICIIGPQKSGKSWLAATAPKPNLIYDWDDRQESLAGKTSLIIRNKPTMLEVETDLSILKAEVVAAKQQKRPPKLPATITHDTVTFMKYAMEAELRRQSEDLFRGIKMGNNTTVYIGKGWDVVNGIQRYAKYIISETIALGVNLIFIFHERDEKDKAESKPDKPVYTGQLTIDPQYLVECLSLFNEVWHVKVEPGIAGGDPKWKVEVKPTRDINASTTMMLDSIEDPDIMNMIMKHRAAKLAKMNGGKK